MIPVAFLVNGDEPSAMGHRARALAAHLQRRFAIRLFYRSRRKLWSVPRLLAALLHFRPKVCYTFDMAYSGVAAGSLYKFLTGNRLVIETGDAITELARSLGRGPAGVHLTKLLEDFSLKAADHMVVRGSYHREWLARRHVRATVIPDGVETELFTPLDVGPLRKQYQLEGVLTVGLVGTTMWSAKQQSCYGWDLVEVVRQLKDQPVVGILVGGGTGLPHLRERCRRYGIEDRVLFLGQIPYEQLPPYLNLMDVCLSTQTNDLPGRVRTTGKLPLYLATGRYVLASRVGEAARLLDEAMLVDFDGTVDWDYPRKLAERLVPLLRDRSLLARAQSQVGLARRTFDYGVLAEKLAGVLAGVGENDCPPAAEQTAGGETWSALQVMN
jgi:glycosyltransferase involved in cell wall biosynthesis